MLTSASHQSRRTPVQRVAVVLAQQRNCSGTFERIWNRISRLDICSCGQHMPSWSLDLVPGPSEAEQSLQLQIKRPRVDMSSQGTGTGQEAVGAAVDPAGRKPKSKQKSKGGAAGGDSNDHGLVSLVLSLEARLRAVEAATYSVVLVPRETSLPFKNMREAGRKYAQMVEAKGRREHDLGSPHLHVFLALLSTLATYVPPQGVDQAVLGRVAGVKTLLEQVIEHQTQAELGEWVTTCRAEDCYDRPQQEKQGRILFATKGTVEVSWRPTDQTKVIPHPLHGPSQQVAEIMTKQMSVQSVLVSLLCAQGGKHKVGAAPRGEKARALVR